jgi:hypothetical protein
MITGDIAGISSSGTPKNSDAEHGLASSSTTSESDSSHLTMVSSPEARIPIRLTNRSLNSVYGLAAQVLLNFSGNEQVVLFNANHCVTFSFL